MLSERDAQAKAAKRLKLDRDAIMFRIALGERDPPLLRSFVMTISDLPALNASLNAFSTIFISAGWYLIRRGHWRQHIACMITAILSSAVFLISYVTYHAYTGSTRFTATGIVRPIYFAILITHVLLAFTVLPLVITTLVPVFRRRWDKHARIARWAMPIWLYVSVTGVIVYLMLYRWFPPEVAQ